MTNAVLDTPEKRAIIRGQKNDIIEFFKAITDINPEYFDDLKQINQQLYSSIKNDFNKKRISRVYIKESYNALFQKNVSTNEIMKQLRECGMGNTFDNNKNLQHNDDSYYYSLMKYHKKT